MREFFIIPNVYGSREDMIFEEMPDDKTMGKVYHVIEKSAYDKAVEALKALAQNMGCGCRPICRCLEPESLIIDKDARIDLARETLKDLGELPSNSIKQDDEQK